MGMFKNIVDKIFHSKEAKAIMQTPSPLLANLPNGGATQAKAAPQNVDVNAVLSTMAASAGQNLNYKESIVDLLKLLNMDSSLSARKDLAHELNYSGDTNDSARMNIWLSQQVITKLAENGGKVPPELRA